MDPAKAGVVHRGVSASVEISDHPDNPKSVLVRFFIDPPPQGIGRNYADVEVRANESK